MNLLRLLAELLVQNYKYRMLQKQSILTMETTSSNFASSLVSPMDLAACMSCYKTSSSFLMAWKDIILL